MLASKTIRDPYKVLNLPHSATQDEIKKAYRILARKYHPDRVTDLIEKERATATFAETSTAYALLSDPRRKAQYDHIYKYGGFDDNETSTKDRIQEGSSSNRGFSSSRNVSSYQTDSQRPGFVENKENSNPNQSRKRKTGIGYVCTDPLAFLWSQGKIQVRQTVAGIQIPSRLHNGSNNGNGFRFAFSEGLVTRSSTGLRQSSCSTTQFCEGQKFTRTETTTYYPDGRKEVVIEGNDCVEERYTTTYPKQQQQSSNTVSGSNKNGDSGVTQARDGESLPWYMNAWSEIKDKLTMCYSPCVVDQRQ
jgi:curved DNA-binding protein CbpA